MASLTQKIRAAAKVFTENHFDNPTREQYLIIENALLEGAQVAIRDSTDSLDKLFAGEKVELEDDPLDEEITAKA